MINISYSVALESLSNSIAMHVASASPLFSLDLHDTTRIPSCSSIRPLPVCADITKKKLELKAQITVRVFLLPKIKNYHVFCGSPRGTT